MREVRRVLRGASRRLLILDFIRFLVITASAGVVAIILLRVVQQAFGLALDPARWWAAAAITGAGAVLAALLCSLATRRGELGVARVLDDRADLRESLSTALCVERAEDPWSRAVVESARQRAARVDIRGAIPYRAPRFWPVPLALALATVVVWFAFPRLDLLGRHRERLRAEQDRARVELARAEVNEARARVDELLRRARVDPGTEDAPGSDGELDPKSPDEIRRAALRRLTSTQEKLAEMKSGEKAQKLDALRGAMKQLRQPGPGPLDRLSRSLARGDFTQARADLDDLSKKLAADALAPEDRAALRQQLATLSEQLSKLGEERREMEKTLEQAGLSTQDAKRLVGDPEALRQALDRLPNLTDAQRQELVRSAGAAAEAYRRCSGLGAEAGRMARGLGEDGMDASGMEGMASMADMLTDLEMAAAELDSLDAAASACSAAIASIGQSMGKEGDGSTRFAMVSPWRAGESRGQGAGQGGPGRGFGGGQQAEEAPATIAKTKAHVRNQAGPIIGSRLVSGDSVRGEAAAEFARAVEAAVREAADEVNTRTIPREYHEAIKTYFGRLAARTKPVVTDPPQPRGDDK